MLEKRCSWEVEEQEVLSKLVVGVPRGTQTIHRGLSRLTMKDLEN